VTEQNDVERAFARTIVRFFGALGERRYEEVGALIAADGIWLRQGQELQGPTEVRTALAKRPRDLTTVHGITNLLVDASTDGTAQATIFVIVFAQQGETASTPRLADPGKLLDIAQRLLVKAAIGVFRR
jgi:SnoaL-like domain